MSERLDEIKARAEAATEGPWTGNNGDGYGAYYVDNPTGRTVARCDYGPYEGSRDATFIAHARTDIPRLVAAVEAVSLHVPEADTTGNVYCVVRGADYYTDCPTFKSGDTWPDHIANVVARALGEES